MTAKQLLLTLTKTEFLAVLGVGNISVAVRDTGITRGKTESWAPAAGVKKSP